MLPSSVIRTMEMRLRLADMMTAAGITTVTGITIVADTMIAADMMTAANMMLRTRMTIGSGMMRGIFEGWSAPAPEEGHRPRDRGWRPEKNRRQGL